jgi:hypothetical protein
LYQAFNKYANYRFLWIETAAMHFCRREIILAQYCKQVFVPTLRNETAAHIQVNQVNVSLFILGLTLRTYIAEFCPSWSKCLFSHYIRPNYETSKVNVKFSLPLIN